MGCLSPQQQMALIYDLFCRTYKTGEGKHMVTNESVLMPGWVTTRQAAEAAKVTPVAFRRWLCRHSEVRRKYVGNVSLVELEYVLREYRRHI
jgi:hypothetical protein